MSIPPQHVSVVLAVLYLGVSPLLGLGSAALARHWYCAHNLWKTGPDTMTLQKSGAPGGARPVGHHASKI